MAHQINKTALVMHSAERMFQLVNDIARYPEFLPGMPMPRFTSEAGRK